MKKTIFIFFVLMLLSATVFSTDYQNIFKFKSGFPYYRTVKELQNNLNTEGYDIIKVVNLKNRAVAMKAKLQPTTLILFTKKNFELKLLRINKFTALEFPFRIVVTKNFKNKVFVAFKNFNYLSNYNVPQSAINKLNAKIKGLILRSINRKPILKKVKKAEKTRKLQKN